MRAVVTPAFSSSLEIVAPQRLQLPQVATRRAAATPLAANSPAISAPMRLALVTEVPLPTVEKKTGWSDLIPPGVFERPQSRQRKHVVRALCVEENSVESTVHRFPFAGAQLPEVIYRVPERLLRKSGYLPVRVVPGHQPAARYEAQLDPGSVPCRGAVRHVFVTL